MADSNRFCIPPNRPRSPDTTSINESILPNTCCEASAVVKSKPFLKASITFYLPDFVAIPSTVKASPRSISMP